MHLRQEFWRMAWLISAVLVVALPHFQYVAPWVAVLVIAIAVWRLAAAERGWPMPRTALRVTAVFLGYSGIMWSYHRVSGVEAGSALLLVMLAFKLMETRSRRDRALVAIICFVLMFATFLREQTIWSPAYLLVGITLSVCALMQVGRFQTRMPVMVAGKTTLKLVVQALPLMAMLFVLFPRVPGPFWAMPVDSGTAQTGLGDSVSPGDITELGRSDAIAFRVRFDGTVPEPAERYWRGPVFGYFNGRSWSGRIPGPGPEDTSVLRKDGSSYSYEITMEPHGRRWLLALETPLSWDQKDASYGPDWQLISRKPVGERFAYRARSVVNGTIPGNDSQRYLQAMRHLPANVNPRTRMLARQLRGSSRDDVTYLRSVLNMFREQEFYYTLTPPRLDDSPVDEFLFETREGFCEHYASAFATLARAAGIPSRVVTGYLGAERNPVGDYWVVRQSDAHAWTEVWIDGDWRRYDPTAAVSPARIEGGLDFAIPDAGRSPVTLLRRSALFGQLALNMDAVNAAWDRWVLSFGPDTQMALLARLGISKPSMRDLMIATLISCGLFLAALSWMLTRRQPEHVDAVLRLYRLYCRRLARSFRVPLHSEGPTDYASAAVAARPDLGSDIHSITNLYLQLRYEITGKTDDPRLLAELRRRIRAFRP
ncbi:MAG: DUF3488 and transglutaminase-like domain-containing protein [Gammaproteobacteria bacterium]|jgi:transglutaminase-like putative cysteine protease|nr:DUF3488 and transglutaminase-like domain-containing protein [Gammaproteobacteria bacterium]MDP6617024.1 DUF3488 and transglutaminase-like domain-containing protein [Gammaproteobacteria bacterium]MDP6695084.1 DUF3488 and transglutaminase-like domain-containing protein [Gammaproteobacteria bacterium]MDP7042072.1 DUF3488 and transglutaminase-like domain-containing protein [Gammaproteobacteria bacterium]